MGSHLARPAFFFFNDTATTEIYTLSLHDALPICINRPLQGIDRLTPVEYPTQLIPEGVFDKVVGRSEEHTSELQSPCNLVCRLLLEKKKPNRVQRHAQALPTVTRSHTVTTTNRQQ